MKRSRAVAHLFCATFALACIPSHAQFSLRVTFDVSAIPRVGRLIARLNGFQSLDGHTLADRSRRQVKRSLQTSMPKEKTQKLVLQAV